MCNETIVAGAEWEPVLLTVVRPFLGEVEYPEVMDGVECEEGKGNFENGGSVLKRETRGFAGAATLREVREALGEPEESLLCQEHKAGPRAGEQGAGEGGGASGWRLFPPTDMQRTLKELSLKDGDALLVLEPQSLDSR